MKATCLVLHIFNKVGLIIFILTTIIGLLVTTKLIHFPDAAATVFSVTHSGFSVTNDLNKAGTVINGVANKIISVLN